jgi:hypothetical protein
MKWLCLCNYSIYSKVLSLHNFEWRNYYERSIARHVDGGNFDLFLAISKHVSGETKQNREKPQDNLTSKI